MTGRLVSLVWVALAGTLLMGTVAGAKGTGLRFDQERYRPGDRAVAHAVVETWPGSRQPEDGPFFVYLVRGTQPLWFGHLPEDAIRVGRLRIGRAVGPDTYRVKVAFRVPQVSDAHYAVWVCRKECGANSGFGYLVYGSIVVLDKPAAPKCTITGTPGSDRLRGTDGRDVICGHGGPDRIRARRGDDILRGGTGRDLIISGPGHDRVLGGPGGDEVFGGGGQDKVRGELGYDSIWIDEGSDVARGGPGEDFIYGPRGVDRIWGGRGGDVCLWSDDGVPNDRVSGGPGRDVHQTDPGDSVGSVERRRICAKGGQ